MVGDEGVIYFGGEADFGGYGGVMRGEDDGEFEDCAGVGAYGR